MAWLRMNLTFVGDIETARLQSTSSLMIYRLAFWLSSSLSPAINSFRLAMSLHIGPISRTASLTLEW